MTHNIKKLREKAGMSQNQLSKLAGIPRSTYGEIESYRKLPRQEELRKIADALGCSVDELLKN